MTTDFSERVAVLADYVGKNFMMLARELKQLQDEKPDLFMPVVKQLGMGRRRAFALARIARIFECLKVPDARLNAIGWTKLNRIGTDLDEDNAEVLLSLAETHTAHKLDLILRGTVPADGARVAVFYLPEEDHARLTKLLTQYGAIVGPNGGITNKERALSRFLDAWSEG